MRKYGNYKNIPPSNIAKLYSEKEVEDKIIVVVQAIGQSVLLQAGIRDKQKGYNNKFKGK